MDLSWSELLIVGVVALIVIGPKDLPGMFRELGRFTAKVRSMGREFSRAMDSAAKESGVKEVADDLRRVANPKSMGLDAVRSAADKFEKWDPMKPASGAKPLNPPPMPPVAAPVAAPAAAPAAAPTDAPRGPATAALAKELATKRAASAERTAAAAGARATSPAKAAKAAEPAVTRGGRVRSKTDRTDATE